MPTALKAPARSTLRDVANHVGVSVNAVSKVVNNTRSSGQVSELTRQRIMEAARKLGYQPNSAARSLVRRRSDIIGLFFDEDMCTAEPFTAALIEGAERACNERLQSLMLYSRSRNEMADDVCRKLLSGVADGIVIAGWASQDLFVKLASSRIPVVTYPYPSPDFPAILVDERMAARMAVEHLARQGHTRILYRKLPNLEPARLGHIQDAARDLGLDLTIMVAGDKYGTVTEQEMRLLARPRSERPTAAVCWNDEFGYRLLTYCEKNGIRVPDELAIIGFDGARTFPTPRRELTTIVMPWTDMAAAAVSLLVDIRDGKVVPQETLLDVEFRLGQTA